MSVQKCWCLIAAVALASQLPIVAPLEQIPEWLHICPSDHPNMAECIRESVTSLSPVLGTGYPALDLPSLDPFELDSFVVSRSAGLLIELTQVKIYNVHKFIVSNLKVVDHGRRYEYDVLFPKFVTNGTYHLSGQLMLMNMNGTGTLAGRYEDVRAHCKTHIVHRRNANGDYSPVVKKFSLRTTVKRGTLQLDNLFGANKELGDALNTAINVNFDAYAKEMLPMMDVRFSLLIKDYTNKLFSHFTSAQLYPGVDVEENP